MEKLTLALLLAATWNLGSNPAKTDVWAQKTLKIDEFGRTAPLFQPPKAVAKTAFQPQKAPTADVVKIPQNAEVAFPPKALLGF